MKRITLQLCFALVTLSAIAQKKPVPLTAEEKQKDSIITATLIGPAVVAAQSESTEPDWEKLSQDVTAQYGAAYAARAVIRCKIYYYYQVEGWPSFSSALVEYTNKYEDRNDVNVLNKNARMILKRSTDKSELKEALNWVESATKKDPANENYKKTYNELKEKLASM